MKVGCWRNTRLLQDRVEALIEAAERLVPIARSDVLNPLSDKRFECAIVRLDRLPGLLEPSIHPWRGREAGWNNLQRVAVAHCRRAGLALQFLQRGLFQQCAQIDGIDRERALDCLLGFVDTVEATKRGGETEPPAGLSGSASTTCFRSAAAPM